MLTKPELACAIIEGIASVRKDVELLDFVVEVEGRKFKCHRLILSACSGFFGGLLRSGMKESQKRRIKLEGVSMETFAAILETLYTGCDNLTRDNMLNVWQAADQLLITFVFDYCVNFITNNICNETVISVWKAASQMMHKSIIELCETFLINNTSLENWEIVYATANSLHSDLILSHVREFIKKNYEQVIKSEAFLYLHENDLLDIIKSQDLIVSTEDVVIESILSWVNEGSQMMSGDKNENVSNLYEQDVYEQEDNIRDGQTENQLQLLQNLQIGDNSKTFFNGSKYVKETSMNCFERLLSETRLCIVNSITLEMLSRHPLVIDNKLTKELVMDAALYKSIGRQHGQWSKGAIHRSCSDLENVGVMGGLNGSFFALSCHPVCCWFKLPDCPYLSTCTTVKLIAYMTDVFAVGDLAQNISILCFFVQNEWRKIKKLSGHGWMGVAVEEFVYLFNSSNRQIKRFYPRFVNCLLEDLSSFPTQEKIEHICSFDLFILVFCSYVVKGVDMTTVYCLDTRSQTWTSLGSLAGSAHNAVSFRKERHLYILQTNGHLWEICSDLCKSINVKWVEVLWNGNYNLFGAICYYDVLIIYGLECFSGQLLPISLFSQVIVNGNQGNWSNIVPAILKKSIFRQKTT